MISDADRDDHGKHRVDRAGPHDGRRGDGARRRDRVRAELRHEKRRRLADDDTITADDLQATATPAALGRSAEGQTDWFGFARLEDFRAATEKEFLRRKLIEFGGNIKRTAENIELQRSNLYKKLDRYGLK